MTTPYFDLLHLLSHPSFFALEVLLLIRLFTRKSRRASHRTAQMDQASDEATRTTTAALVQPRESNARQSLVRIQVVAASARMIPYDRDLPVGAFHSTDGISSWRSAGLSGVRSSSVSMRCVVAREPSALRPCLAARLVLLHPAAPTTRQGRGIARMPGHSSSEQPRVMIRLLRWPMATSSADLELSRRE